MHLPTTRALTMKKTISLLLLFCLMTSFSLFSEVLQYQNHIVSRLEIKVHTNSGDVRDNKNLCSKMLTKEGCFFQQNDFDEDLKTLSQEFDRIEPTISILEDKVHVTIELWNKPVIEQIRWHGNIHIATNKLQDELKIRAGEIFDRSEFNTAFHKLKTYYTKKGYFEAELDYNHSVDCETNRVEIDIIIREGRSGKIRSINFVNFTEREESEVTKEMLTKKYNLLWSWITEEGTYNEEMIQQDQLIITNYLQNQGYADAQVSIEVEEICQTNRINLTITADKGERYYFGCLSFEGNCLISSEKINALFTVHTGDPYSIDNLRETIENITDAYGRLGYIDARVDFDPDLAEGENAYDIRFTIEEGEQYRIGLVRVFGNSCTKTSVILHETLLIPGEIFNVIKLKATELRLTNVGYFKNVNVYFVKGTESPLGNGYRDVYIEVEETGTGQFSAFLGYSTAEDLFGGINITENNFDHEGFYYFWQDGISAFRGGGEYAHITLQIGQKSSNYTLSWTKPYFMDTPWSIGFDLSKSSTEYISRDYEIDTVSLVLRAQYDINSFVRFGLQYRLKNGVVYLHRGGKHNKELEEAADVHGLISAVAASISYDSTDHPIKPTMGFRSKFSAEYAGIGGDHSFLNIGYYNCYFMPVGSRMVVKYRADFRFIQPLNGTVFDTVPLDERIFLGGDFNVRGYRPYRLGPDFNHKDEAPKGGISMQFYSVELARRLTQDYEPFIFFDAAHLSQYTWSFGRMSCSVGYGIRCKFLSSIPPITLGMGYPLNARNRGEIKRFFITVGGNF